MTLYEHEKVSKDAKSIFQQRFRWRPRCRIVRSLMAHAGKLNPLSPKSDQHQISPYNISALLNRVVMRITDMITQDEFA